MINHSMFIECMHACMHVTPTNDCSESQNTAFPFGNEAALTLHFSTPASSGFSLTSTQEFTALARRECITNQPEQESKSFWVVRLPCGIWVWARG